MVADEDKQRVSIVICGHVDAGKSTTTGRLIFELGGIDEREKDKLQKEADILGKSSFAFAFYMDRQKEERERGVTIACTTKEFFTESKRYTIIDAPGHRDFIKNMISGASQADVSLLMVPADGNFTTALAKGNPKAGEVTGQTRQHALLLGLLGCKQLIVGVNKMDCDMAKYSEARFTECRDEAKNMLNKTGWGKAIKGNQIPIIPLSGWKGDNLKEKSTNMGWWKGVKVIAGTTGKEVEVFTLLDALENFVEIPPRPVDAPMRTPISGVYKPKGAGDVVTGRVEQGTVNVSKTEKVIFLPSHQKTVPCRGTIFKIEMHHKDHQTALPGDNVGMQIKGFDKVMPKTGDVMIYEKDEKDIGSTVYFTASVSVQNHPSELKEGYCPIAFVRTGRAAVRVAHVMQVKRKGVAQNYGDEGNKQLTMKNGDTAKVTFIPQQKFVVDEYDRCAGLGRVAIMDGNSVVMLGRVTKVVTASMKADVKDFPVGYPESKGCQVKF